MCKTLRQFKGYVGRMRHDLQDIPQSALHEKVLEALWLVGHLLN